MACKCCSHKQKKNDKPNRDGERGVCSCSAETEEEGNRKLQLVCLIVSSVLFAVGFFFSGWLRFAVYAAAFLLAGYEVILDAFRALFGGGLFDENVLMLIAGTAAFAIGEYPEAVAVLLLFSVGEMLEDFAVERTKRSVSALSELKPEEVCVLREGKTVTVDPSDVAAGELIFVKPGERIPLDGVVVSGASSVSTAALTGEPAPVDVAEGSAVISGSVNLTGDLTVRSSGVYSESTVARILRLMEESGAKKSKTERFISRFAKIYTPVVCVLALLVAVLPPLAFGEEWSTWIFRALTFLVASCPCALVISVPLAFFSGIGLASRNGILVKDSISLERLACAETAVFDKTGTLTEGSFVVTDIHPNGVPEKELLDLAACAEAHSPHPIAESVVRAAGMVNESRITDARELPGLGAVACVDGAEIAAGNERLMKEKGAEISGCRHDGTTVHLSRDGKYIGHILIRDRIKPGAETAVKSLRSEGVDRIVMLSGDHRASAKEIADALGIREVRSELLPEGKTAAMEQLIRDAAGKGTVVYAGDGMNDAPVLRISDVGIAMGALGSDAAVESADAVICDDDPQKVPLAVRIGKRTVRVARDNMIFALAVKALVMLLGLFGLSPMWLAVAADVGVTLVCVLLASLRLKK